MLAMLPQSVMDDKSSGCTKGPWDGMISRRYHKDGAAQHGFLGDQPIVGITRSKEIRQNGRRGGYVLEEPISGQNWPTWQK